MSEYWKSTPRYWCKHCSVYVRDTKLERQNHEATGRHQGAVKRALRDLHRDHERGEREKERAKREVERLNGVVSSGSGSGPSAWSSREQMSGDRDGGGSASGVGGANAQRQQQMEQLAELGVSIPEQFRGDMAMAGEWTVTATRVVKDNDSDGPDSKDRTATGIQATATGVRKREKTEEEQKEEDAVMGLFKKRKRWGRDVKTMPVSDETDLDALLSGSLVKAAKNEEATEETNVKREDEGVQATDVAADTDDADDGTKNVPIKPDPEEADQDGLAGATTYASKSLLDRPLGTEEATAEEPAVVFKKRKSKTARQK